MQLPCSCSGGGCSGAADGSSNGSGGDGLPAAAELGPSTPDDHSPDPSDASSDDMSAELPCYLGMAEAAAADAAARSSANAEAAAGAAGSTRQQQAAAGLQTFSAHFSSQCEHHLLPFYGKLKLAYLPAPGSSGSSSGDRAALRQIVVMFSKRLQVQERLTHQVADAGAAGCGWERLARQFLPCLGRTGRKACLVLPGRPACTAQMHKSLLLARPHTFGPTCRLPALARPLQWCPHWALQRCWLLWSRPTCAWWLGGWRSMRAPH